MSVDILSQLDSALDGLAQPPAGLSDELFAVVDLLDSAPALRRALTNPNQPPTARQGLVTQLLAERVDPAAVTVVADGARMRWGSARRLVDAVEQQGVRAALGVAAAEGQLEEVADELFRFSRLVAGDAGLRTALADRGRAVGERQQLVATLLAGRAQPTTVALAQRAVKARQRTFSLTVEYYTELAARLRDRVIATVRVAIPMSEEQTQRLQAALTRQTGRQVSLRQVVDPSVMGGVEVSLGDEVLAGTVAWKLGQARRHFSSE